MSESANTDTPEPAAPTESVAAPTDQKAAFKAALDKKNAAAHARSQHLDGDNHVVGSSHSGATQRMFRRKSGG